MILPKIGSKLRLILKYGEDQNGDTVLVFLYLRAFKQNDTTKTGIQVFYGLNFATKITYIKP